MKRAASADLDGWIKGKRRKPLILRGARQVGKSWLVRDFVSENGRSLVELNFERNPSAASLFGEGGAREMLRGIEAFTSRRIDDQTILFLDEIQAAPEVLAKLRWFAEERPDIPVVVAGSLLDFVLAEHTFSMPVGRLSFLYLEPMSFTEFLDGIGESELARAVTETGVETTIPTPVHERILVRFREYLLVGGMPEAVDTYRESGSLLDVARVHQDLLATYRDDFAKYSDRVHRDRLTRVLDAVPRQLGRKFVYSNVDREERAAALRKAVDMLCLARVCHRVRATHANGVPLGAEVDERRFKLISADVGLVSATLGLSLRDLEGTKVLLANEGAIAEQAVGQALRLIEPRFHDPALFYWTRDARGSEAEVDYVIQHGREIVPVEVKAGSTGSLRSLATFVAARNCERALRFNTDRPSRTEVSTRTSTGIAIDYELLSLPIYLASEAGRLLA